MRRHIWGGLALFGLGLLSSVPPSLAGETEENPSTPVRPLPPLELNQGLHDFTLSASEGYGWTKSRSPALPDSRRDAATSTNLAFSIGERGFAALGSTYDRQWGHTASSPANSSFPFNVTTKNLQGRVLGGYAILPYLSVGGLYTWGRDWGYSQGPGVAAVNLDGRVSSFSPFALLTIPRGPWTYNLMANYMTAWGYMNYTDNTPDRAKTWAQSSTLQPAVSYRIQPQWKVSGNVSWNHTFSYFAGEFELSTPRDWAIVGLGTSYDLTEALTLSINANGWVNENYHRQQIIFGVQYKL